MGKRKADSDDDSGSEYEQDTDSEEVKKPVKKAKKSPTRAKKATAKAEGHESTGDVEVLVSDEGDKYLSLGKLKRATVRSFKGMQMIDIREFYVDKSDGKEKPGKKGISLQKPQWDELKRGIETIDSLFEQLG